MHSIGKTNTREYMVHAAGYFLKLPRFQTFTRNCCKAFNFHQENYQCQWKKPDLSLDRLLRTVPLQATIPRRLFQKNLSAFSQDLNPLTNLRQVLLLLLLGGVSNDLIHTKIRVRSVGERYRATGTGQLLHHQHVGEVVHVGATELGWNTTMEFISWIWWHDS